jgi:hypothetical protein
MHRSLLPAARRLFALGAAVIILAGAAPAARAVEIIPDTQVFTATLTLPATQAQVSWNLSRLKPAVSGGEGFVAWAVFGPTDMPTASKVRTAWLEREIARMHERLGNTEKFTVRMPRHFEPSSIGGSAAFTSEFEVVYAGRSFLNPIHIVPLPLGRGRFVVFGMMGKDEVVSKAAGSFAEHWAGKLREAQ